MRCLWRGVMLFAFMSVVLPSLVMATETARSHGTTNPAIQGELIKIENTVFTVKDMSGQKRQLKVDQHTAQFGVFHQGVYVQAWVRPDGRTESIVAFRTNRDSERELATRP